MKLAKAFLALVALVPCGAMAEEGPTPVAVGEAHTCQRYYPDALAKQGIEGTTALAFDITRDGGVTRARIAKPSGHKELDQAAVSCVALWRYKPAMQDGEPVTMPWHAKVAFTLPEQNTVPVVVLASASTAQPSSSSPVATGESHGCAHYYPIALMQQGIEGTTAVAFDIRRDGGVSRVRIEEPSGHKELDQAAVSCVVYWRYKPATENGKPVTMPWHAKVTFALPPPNPPAAP